MGKTQVPSAPGQPLGLRACMCRPFQDTRLTLTDGRPHFTDGEVQALPQSHT